jgi:hypothetical protein
MKYTILIYENEADFATRTDDGLSEERAVREFLVATSRRPPSGGRSHGQPGRS